MGRLQARRMTAGQIISPKAVDIRAHRATADVITRPKNITKADVSSDDDDFILAHRAKVYSIEMPQASKFHIHGTNGFYQSGKPRLSYY
jgi:hypothetical protein